MTFDSDAARAFSRANGDRFLQELFEMLRIPSVSADPAFAGDVKQMAAWLAEHLAALGLDKAAVMPTAGHPVVYGEWLGAGPDKPTVLVYGHYDVMPAVMEDGWDTPPFEPVVKDGKVYARGVTDDKGQLFIQVKALESWLNTAGAAPVNVKLLLEGEEEVSSPNLVPFIVDHMDLLRADVCVISDSSMRVVEEPAITHSLRGMAYLEVWVKGPKEDLHSGFWGGATYNPALALAEILSKLYNPDNTIAVPGFYDDVVPLNDAEREMIARNDLTPEVMISCLLTCTDDLDAEFPAVAARALGLNDVPLLCTREMDVPGSMPRVIRAMVHYYAPADHKPAHTYLGGAAALRSDLASAQ